MSKQLNGRQMDLESYARTAANLMALGMSRRAVIEEAIEAGHEPSVVIARALVLYGQMRRAAQDSVDLSDA